MSFQPRKIVLASRSPRRKELLGLLVPEDRITVLPPPSSEEAGFEGLHSLFPILQRLQEIARQKAAAVAGLLSEDQRRESVILSADTTVIATAEEQDDHFEVLGQPPDSPDWQKTVRHWFQHYYAGRMHQTATAVCVMTPAAIRERWTLSRVSFHADIDRWLEWYLSTGESVGKAGGYAVQGLASVFVRQVEGSLSNIVGLPLETVLELFRELQVEL